MSNPPAPRSQRRTAIVGAGIAGLSAARFLASAGGDVMVFDGARRPGGRASSYRDGAFAFDHGAQYFTARDPAFLPLVESWRWRGIAAAWDGVLGTLGSHPTSDSRGVNIRYVGIPGMDALALDLAGELDVECGRNIQRIERAANGWSLFEASGPPFEGFDSVVVAAPAPQAAPLLAAAPALRERVADVEMRACHAVLVAFAEPLEVPFDAAFVSDSPLSWVARDASKPRRVSRECWVLHTTPEWTASHSAEVDRPAKSSKSDGAAAEAERVAAAGCTAFAEALGFGLPSIAFRTSIRWRFARTENPLGEPFLWDSEARMGVCGDWAYGGRLENAFLSGHHLARHLVGS